MLKRLVLVGAVFLAGGCDSISSPGEERVVGIIVGFESESPEIEVPSTAQAGEELTVVIRTAWRDSCVQPDATVVEMEGAKARVTPYDLVNRHATCAQEPREITHSTTLSFPNAGLATVTVRGRASDDDEVLEREFDVEVVP